MRAFECTRHQIRYRTTASHPQCPVCSLEHRVKSLQTSLATLNNEITVLHEQNQRLRMALEPAEAMREAIQLLNGTDRAFLKAALYQYRADHSTMLKATQGPNGKATGFITRPLAGEPQAMVCTSLGGVAIAQFFQTACQRHKDVAAMDQLLHAFTLELTGGLDG